MTNDTGFRPYEIRGEADWQNFVIQLSEPTERDLTRMGEDTYVKTTDRDGRLSEWVPWQMQFKAPSEHTVVGKQMDVELQIAYRTP